MKWSKELEARFGDRILSLEMKLIQAENALGLAMHELHTYELDEAARKLDEVAVLARHLAVATKDLAAEMGKE